MKRTQIAGFGGSLVLAVLALVGCQQSQPAGSTAQADDASLQVSGPFTHENLAVFLIRGDSQDDREYLTLQEGLQEGIVKLSEMDQAQVGQLQIENNSDSPLFLQEGDRISGGKQDRIIIASQVVPAKSGKVTVRTFCVEQSRWSEGSGGKRFAQTVNPGLAPKAVRGNAKIEAEQGGVWQVVQAQKRSAANGLKTGNSSSSLNETLDSPQILKVTAEHKAALGEAPDQADVVGVAFVVNGKIEEINVYPNHGLLRKLYPRLLEAYALHAVMLKSEAKDAQAISAEEIAQCLKPSQGESTRDEQLDADNRLQVMQLADKCYYCTTAYQGKLVHRQVILKNKVDQPADAKRGEDTLGSDWAY